jgi:hypothetical protein
VADIQKNRAPGASTVGKSCFPRSSRRSKPGNVQRSDTTNSRRSTIKVIINATTSKVRRPSWATALAVLSMVAAACAGTDQSTSTSSSLLAITKSTAGEVDTTTSIETAVPTTTAMVTTPTLPIPLEKDDRIFRVGTDIVIAAHAPPPWQPFSTIGMKRDQGTAEWVGITFWEPLEVSTDSCRWQDSWETPGESVAELADALVAMPGRQATTPVPVTLGGYEGLYLEWSLPADLDLATCDEETAVAWKGDFGRTRGHDIPGMIDRIWVLDVEGERILIDAISLPVEQEIIRQRVDEVIDSLRFVVEP